MPVTALWDDENPSLIHLHYTNPLTWVEFGQVFHELRNMASQRERVAILHHTFGLIVPAGNPFPHFQREFRMASPNIAIIVILTNSTLLASLVRMASKFYGGDLRVLADEQEARALATSRLAM